MARPSLRTVAVVATMALSVAAVPVRSIETGIVLRERTEPTGRIAGRVRLGIKPPARPLPSSAYPSRRIAMPGTPGPEVANVLVWLRDAPPAGSLVPESGEIRQRDEMFVPRVVAIPVGSTVRFPNDDPYFHNVFSLSKHATFDLGRYRRGTSRSRQFTHAGIVKVFCQLHANMSALIAVFDHPYYAQVDTEGAFAVDEVPPGRYTLTAWHERAGDVDQPVTVEAGGTTSLDLLVPIAEP